MYARSTISAVIPLWVRCGHSSSTCRCCRWPGKERESSGSVRRNVIENHLLRLWLLHLIMFVFSFKHLKEFGITRFPSSLHLLSGEKFLHFLLFFHSLTFSFFSLPRKILRVRNLAFDFILRIIFCVWQNERNMKWIEFLLRIIIQIMKILFHQVRNVCMYIGRVE